MVVAKSAEKTLTGGDGGARFRFMLDDNNKDVMTADEVAEVLRVSRPTVLKMVREGRAARSFRVGKKVLFRRADVLEWIERSAAADENGTRRTA